MQVESINLVGLDRVLVAYAAGSSDRSLLLRQYRIQFKKSGTKVRDSTGADQSVTLRRAEYDPAAAACLLVKLS